MNSASNTSDSLLDMNAFDMEQAELEILAMRVSDEVLEAAGTELRARTLVTIDVDCCLSAP